MNISKKDLKQLTPNVFEIPKTFRSDMRVPARIYASQKLMEKIFEDKSLIQLVNTTTLPGVFKYALAMPDIHQGFGVPIGGIIPIDIKDGVISPGAVGFDIKCSVGLFASEIGIDEIKNRIPNLAEKLFREVPSGLGVRGPIKISQKDYKNVLEKGALWALEKGFGKKEDLENMEDGGVFEGAKAECVSERAKKRGENGLGTLGSGNHFLEIQLVEKIFNPSIAKKWGLFQNQITIMLHCGSRGLGHQVCADYINIARTALNKYKIKLPDLELACMPFNSKEGQDYFAAMAGAANYAYANHQILSHFIRKAWGGNLRLIYHMGHNIACVEEHKGKKLCVHRKGATRCKEGKPVLIPGSMGTASYVLVGQKKAEETFNSCAHGAGRVMSRQAAKRQVFGEMLKKELEQRGIFARSRSISGLAEEAPLAYKNIDEVVRVVDSVGLAKKVARLVPLGVVKG